MADSNLKPWPTYYAYAHKIQRCDATTGHTVKDVAFCGSPERAKEMAEAFIRADLVEPLADALRQIEREMRAGLGSSYGETREQVRRALAAYAAAQSGQAQTEARG